MIATLILIAALAGFVYMTVQIEPFLSDRIITCNCGKRRTYRHVIVDPIDLDCIAQTLTEACPTCQANLHGRDRWDRRYERSRQLSAISRQPRNPEPDRRSLSHANH